MTFTGDTEDYRIPPVLMMPPLPLCQTIKREIETSTDAVLVAEVSETLLRQGRLLAEISGADPSVVTPDVPQFTSFAETLAARARSLAPRPPAH